MADGDKFMYTGALLFCDQGCSPSVFLAGAKKHHLYGPYIGTDIDTIPLLNVPPFVLCRAGSPCPCVPTGLRWEKYHDGALKIEKHHPLLVTSVCKCAKGGTIHVFDSMTSLLAFMDKCASKYPMLKKAKQKILSKFDKMLSMVVVPPAMAGILDAMGYGNELEAYGRGIRKGLQGTVGGLADLGYNLIAHPIDSRVGLAKTAVIAVSYSPNSLLVGGQDKVLSSMDKALGTDLLEQKNAMEASLKSEAKDMANTAIHGTSTEKAELAGRITEFVAEFFVGTKGAANVTKAGKAVNAVSNAKNLTSATKGIVKVKKGDFLQSTKAKKLKILKQNKKNGLKREVEVKQELINEGHKILGTQVSVKTPYNRRIIDIFIKDKRTKQPRAIEVKSGNAKRNPMQIKKDAWMSQNGGKVIGKNAPTNLKNKTMKIDTEVRH